MWTKSKSLTLSFICTTVFIAADIAFMALMPLALDWYFGAIGRQISISGLLYCSLYGAGLFALLDFCCLWKLLSNIRAQRVFCAQNVVLLRVMSWGLFGIAASVLPIYKYFVSVVLVSFAAAFFALNIRVLKNVFVKAVEIKEENDATI